MYLKKRNPFIVWLLLPIITFSIYHFIYIYKTSKELNSLNKDDNKYPKLEYLTFIAIAGCFSILTIYGVLFMSDYLPHDNNHSSMISASFSYFSGFITSYIPILYPYYKIASYINRLESDYNVPGNKCDKILGVLLYFCFSYNIVYIQSHINRLIDHIKNNE